jgi:hypothetical protein
LPGSLGSLRGKSSKYLDYFFVGNLPEITIIEANGSKKRVIFEADDIIGVGSQRSQIFRRRHRHCENKSSWLAGADCPERGARCRTGGNPSQTRTAIAEARDK